MPHLADPNEMIDVPGVGGRRSRQLGRQTLAEVVQARYEELFTLIQAELRRTGFEEFCAAGIVLTGGAAKMEGVIELAEEIFHMPVRLGVPRGVSGLVHEVSSPIHATGVGLLQFGVNNRSTVTTEQTEQDGVSMVIQKMKSWFQGNF